MASIVIDIKEHGYDRPIVLQSVSFKDYSEFEKGSKHDPESTVPALTLLTKAIKDAPFPHATVEDLEEVQYEVIIEMTLGMETLMGPLLEKVRKRRGGNSKKPSEADGPTTPN